MHTERKIGQYILKEKIGEGGYANVFLARTPAGRHVALKVLKRDKQKRPNVLYDFKREAGIHQRLNHDNIVRCDGLDRVGNEWVIVMEYFPASTLKKMEHDIHDLQATVNVLVQLSGALCYIHEKGYVHLDLKPGNVLVNESKQVKLIDFCLAFKKSFGSRLFRRFLRKTIPGSPSYMAPEVIRGEPPGNAADLYSLGVIAYYLVTGRVPFTGISPVKILEKQKKSTPVAPSRYNPALPPELEVLIFKLLAKDRRKRLSDANLFCRELLLIAKKSGIFEDLSTVAEM